MPLFEQLTEREKDVYSHDYGGMVHHKPKKVAQFQPDTDLKQLMEEAANDQLSVTLRGAGRGCAGQSLSKGGTLIERYQRDARLTGLDGAQATAAASSNLCRLELALNEHGLSLPVVPVYLNLSLGGVLSAGGLGFHSITQGQTVEHVRSFTLMTPKGERLLVSSDSHETLFRHVLCGQGQLGVIEEATMGLVPYKPYTHFAHYTFDDLNAFLKSLSWISSWRGDATLQFVGSIGLEEPHVAMYGEDVAESSDPVCAPWLQQGGLHIHTWKKTTV